jgi:pimeloyl-ACP methyl ester carboxylesterase
MYTLHMTDGYRFIDEGPASDLPPVVLLHGMLGDIDNWLSTVQALADHQYRVLVPVLPVYELPIHKTNVQGLVDFVHGFLRHLGLERVVLVGNSLGGQVALFYALTYPEAVVALILSGSSGIYEMETGTTTLRRRDRNFIRERAAVTFYDPVHVTDELVDEAYDLVNDRTRALRLIKMARSAQSETVTDKLAEIEAPTLLVWGRDDLITPPDVAEAFKSRLPNATVIFIDRCGHAPMIEHPEAFNETILAFLRETIGAALTPSPGAS